MKNIFIENQKEITFEDYMSYKKDGRENLGDSLPVAVYRMLEYSLRSAMIEEYGKEAQIRIFRKAGFEAGTFFAKNYLDLDLPLERFLGELQTQLEMMKIGVLRVEGVNSENGTIMLTVSEDADCSGLPLLGETVCNYDEGFIAGILTQYTEKEYKAEEIDCWATGERVCRFRVEPLEE
ncbi:MAG: V4R domain-containing protein [Bariatricus sp.]